MKDSSGTLYVLSNNHVLANESGIDPNGQKIVGLPPGSPIYQPGLLDGGNVATDQIAQLTRWVDLDASNPNNAVDGEIARCSTRATSRMQFSLLDRLRERRLPRSI